LIIYRKAAQVRVRRSSVPEPPWWYATSVAPYGARRAAPIAIDYLDLRASWSERMEVPVTDDARDDLERLATRLEPPVLIDAAEFSESIFRRGREIAAVLAEWHLPATLLLSTRGDIEDPDADMIALAAWPVDLERIETLASGLQERAWGMVVPIMFPVTTDLALLEMLSQTATRNKARFFTGISVEIDATAKQAMARSLTLPDDEETYQSLFHADLEPVHIATERHIAALAAASDLADFIVPPGWPEKTNWNAAILLTLTATRMLALQTDTELAGTIARSARVVAQLEKPISRIAEAASLAIVDTLDEASVDILTDWISDGRSPFVDRVNEQWRLRRDAGMGSEELKIEN
jgi:hypothetical protein